MNLQLQFTIEGEKQMSRNLRGISEDMKDFYPQFRSTGRLLLKTFDENFSTQGRTIGEPWARLKSSTVKEKVRLGYAGVGILMRTGRMRRSFKSRPSRTQVEISNPTAYFAYHQSNKPRRKLPRRVMMKIDERRREQITKIFQSAVAEKLKERS